MSHTILLVEDNEDNRTIYRLILEHAGYRVLEAGNGEAGIRMAREGHPDLILMDISMPVINGWEATRVLKADPATSAISIIALTAHALASDRVRARDLGCDDYLVKPVQPKVVLDSVQRLLAGSEEREEKKTAPFRAP